MKIDDIAGKNLGQIGNAASEGRVREAGEDFGNILQAIANVGSESKAPSDSDPIPIGPPVGITPASLLLNFSNETDDVLDKLETALNQLEQLESSMQDPGQSPRQLDLSFRALNEKLPELQETLNGLPEQDPLRAIGEELNILSYVESIKWNRGDYL